MNAVPLENVRLKDVFFSPYYKLVCDVIIPYQWEVLNDRVEGVEKSHCIDNIKIAAGIQEGEFYGLLFQDSDAAKWLEALAYCLMNGDAASYEAHADEVVSLIAKAQQEDGYFNTYFQISAPERRLTNLLEAHEMYCLGHLIEAAVAYEKATGKKDALNIVCRFADLIDSRFGKDEGKTPGYPGHQELELALVKLYEATGEKKYLSLAKYFLDQRGTEPNYFDGEWEKRGGFSEWTKRKEDKEKNYKYNQAHLPVREQKTAVGHAVRAVYMYTAMAEVGRVAGDESLLEACRVLFADICRQMYVTGGIGSTNHGEAFTFAYDLPNETNYSETCASIGLIFFMHSMLKAEAKGIYADVMERALYNTVLAGLQTDGKSYFYVNPMEVYPKANENHPIRRHVKPVRQKWHACACCPPNVARMLASLGQYLYSAQDDTAYVHLYAESEVKLGLSGGQVRLAAETKYPLDGNVKLTLNTENSFAFTVALRVPGWCNNAAFKLNGKEIYPEVKDGYAYITGDFNNGDCIELIMPMEPKLVYANSQIRADAGKACVQRGPLVYCAEEQDNGENLHGLVLNGAAAFTERADKIGGMDCVVLTAQGYREESPCDEVYSFAPKKRTERDITLVPYHLWGNRTPGEMLVWLRVTS